MEIEEITAYEFTCTPMDRGYPIRSCVVTIYARTRDEAEAIFDENAHKFFDKDMFRSVKEFGGGYRQVIK